MNRHACLREMVAFYPPTEDLDLAIPGPACYRARYLDAPVRLCKLVAFAGPVWYLRVRVALVENDVPMKAEHLELERFLFGMFQRCHATSLKFRDDQAPHGT